MKLVPVTSSAISQIGWHKEIGLVVRFHGGNLWCYDDHNRAIFNAIMDAPSKGQAFDRLVKKADVTGLAITEPELFALSDTDDIEMLKRQFDPVTHLRGLLKTNRASAYF